MYYYTDIISDPSSQKERGLCLSGLPSLALLPLRAKTKRPLSVWPAKPGSASPQTLPFVFGFFSAGSKVARLGLHFAQPVFAHLQTSQPHSCKLSGQPGCGTRNEAALPKSLSGFASSNCFASSSSCWTSWIACSMWRMLFCTSWPCSSKTAMSCSSFTKHFAEASAQATRRRRRPFSVWLSSFAGSRWLATWCMPRCKAIVACLAASGWSGLQSPLEQQMASAEVTVQ